MSTYRDLLRRVIGYGETRLSPDGVYTTSLPGGAVEHDMRTGFPWFGDRRVSLEAEFRRFQWIVRGMSRTDWLQEHGVSPPGSDDFGDLSYGHQLRHFNAVDREGGCDQLARLLSRLSSHPRAGDHVITWWHPQDVAQSASPVCLSCAAFVHESGELSLNVACREWDVWNEAPVWIACFGWFLTLLGASVRRPVRSLQFVAAASFLVSSQEPAIAAYLASEETLPEVRVKRRWQGGGLATMTATGWRAVEVRPPRLHLIA